jgi:hypothetical protein
LKSHHGRQVKLAVSDVRFQLRDSCVCGYSALVCLVCTLRVFSVSWYYCYVAVSFTSLCTLPVC